MILHSHSWKSISNSDIIFLRKYKVDFKSLIVLAETIDNQIKQVQITWQQAEKNT